MATVYEPIDKCQKCGGPVWDNRVNKKNPKGPDWKCRDKSCDEAFWLKDPKDGPAKAPAKTAPVRHTQITVNALAEKMNDAYEALQLAGFGTEMILLDTCYKMAFTELKGRTGD